MLAQRTATARMAARARATSRPEPHAGYYIHTGRAVAGTWVRGEEDALAFSAVWACVKVIAETVAGLPWRVGARNSDGSRTPMDRHALRYILNDAPNEEMVSCIWRERMVVWAALWGDAYCEIQRDAAGRVAALWPIEPHRVYLERDAAKRLVYRVQNQGAPDTYLAPRDMFHVRGLGPSGLVGYYVVALFKEAIGLGLATEAQAAAFFGNQGMPSGFLRHPGMIDNEKAQELLENFEGRHMGPSNRGRVGLLKGGLEWVTAGTSNEDAQLAATRTHQVLEACRIFRVPPHKVAELSRATFSNIAEQETAFGRDTIAPWTLRFSQEADAKLFTDAEKAMGFYTRMVVEAIMRGDPLAQMQVFKLQQEMGILSVNEIRALSDMNPLGEVGDKRLILGNYTTLERIGEAPPPPPAAGPPLTSDDDDADETIAEGLDDEEDDEDQTETAARAAAAMRPLLLDLTSWLARRARSAIQDQARAHRLATAAADGPAFCRWLEDFTAKTADLLTGRLKPVLWAWAELTDLPQQALPAAARRLGLAIAHAAAEPFRGHLPWTEDLLDQIGPAWAIQMADYLIGALADLDPKPKPESRDDGTNSKP